MASSRGSIGQSANLYSIDAVLRIFHTVMLATRGGFSLARDKRDPRWESIPIYRTLRHGQDNDRQPGPPTPHRLAMKSPTGVPCGATTGVGRAVKVTQAGLS